MKTVIFSALSAGFMLVACGDDSESQSSPDTHHPDSSDLGDGFSDTDADPGPEVCSPAIDDRGEAFACVKGRVVNEQGQGVARARVQACTLVTCIIGNTNPEGYYSIGQLPVESHKMEVITQGFMTLGFFQDVKASEFSVAPKEVVIPRQAGEFIPWLQAQGGVVSLASGRLELIAGPGVLRYPTGTIEEEQLVMAVEIPAAQIPPHDAEPWIGKTGVQAFVINPFPLGANEGLELAVHPKEGESIPTPGTRYRLFSSDGITSRMTEAGVLVADENGVLRFDGENELTYLTTLVLIPE